MSGPMGYSGANTFDTNSYLPLVVEAFNGSLSNPTWTLQYADKRQYRDIIDYDIDHDGTSELILPFGRLLSWEVRNFSNGAVLDTILHHPSVDLFKLFVLYFSEQKLCYIEDSTLFIYEADIVTGVFDDPETDQAAFDVTAVSAHPNPFNSAVTLTWPVAAAATSLTIYNVLGQAIISMRLDGRSEFTWDGCDLQSHQCLSGIYIAQVASRDFTAHKKIVLLR